MSTPGATKTTSSKGDRFYTWLNENYWSVTTIIKGGLPKPALIHWAGNQVAEYVVENQDKVWGLLRPTADTDEARQQDRDDTYDFLKRTPWRARDKAADLGTAIHEATEAYVLGKPMPPWTPLVKPRMVQFERFLLDYWPEYQEGMVEAPVFNRTERYAGTLDAIVHIGGRRLVLDTKSGKGIYPDVGLQLAAYRHAEFIGAPDGSEQPMPETDGAAALHLREDGYDLIEVRADDEVFRAFLYVREVYRFKIETEKTVLLGNVSVGDGAQEVLPV